MEPTAEYHLKIRERQLRGRPREACGAYVVWTEYQVVDGRKIVGRFELREQAERFVSSADHKSSAA